MDIKKGLFERAAALLREDAIIATNTSSLSVTKLADFVTGPQRFVGIHFFNPVPLMALVEVVKGAETSDATVAAARAFAEAVGKTPITVTDSPGFVVNRILFPMINEAANAFAEGVASAEDIDTGMKLGANWPMGPLALADLVGLDTTKAILETLERELGDAKYQPSTRARRARRAGQAGPQERRRLLSVLRDARGGPEGDPVTPLERRLRAGLHRRRQGQDHGRARPGAARRSAKGLRPLVLQFMKSDPSWGEIVALERARRAGASSAASTTG